MPVSSHLPDLVDAYIEARAQRLEKDKEAEKLKEHEVILYNAIIEKMKVEGLSAAGGDRGLVKLHKNYEPKTYDWQELCTHIQSTGEFEFLHKRLTTTAVEERWEAGISVPGVTSRIVYKLSVSK